MTSSFAAETRFMQRKLQSKLPVLVHSGNDSLENVAIQTKVPHLTTKDEESSVVKKAFMLPYSKKNIPRKHEYESTQMGQPQCAVKRGGAGVYIPYPSGE